MGRELDAEVAEKLLGWEWLERPDDHDGTPRKALYPPANEQWTRLNFHPSVFKPAQPTTERFSDWDGCCRSVDGKYGLPAYSSDIAAAMEVEDRIAEEGRQELYIVALSHLIGRTEESRLISVWDLIHATPEQRCIAALNATLQATAPVAALTQQETTASS